jgi:hypothetical protein
MNNTNRRWQETNSSSSPLCFFPAVNTNRDAKSFPTPAAIRTNLSQKQSNKRLFVAILTSDGRKPFAGNHHNFADLIQMGKRMGITVYVVTPQGISPNKKYVVGYVLHQMKPTPTFQKNILPLPDVVYNRVPYRSDEKSASIARTTAYFKQKHIPMFNPYFFNKWALFQDLSATSCQSYLPATAKFADYASFQQMAAKHNSLILKPIEGKAGIGMIKVEGTGPYTMYYQTKQQKQKLSFPTLAEVYHQIQKRTQNRAYLIQQAIHLATYQGRPFDIRMLVQKDHTAQWKVTGIGVRVAGKKAISTHVPMGGKIENFHRVLTAIFPDRQEEIQQQLKQLGVTFAKEIEAKTAEKHGEMSLDIGIDQSGKLWFFEANAKPQKFDEPAIRTRSLQRILQYSLYLSGFSSSKKDALT